MDKDTDRAKNGYDPKATEATRRRYQRNSRFYDRMEERAEKQFTLWRQQLWALVTTPQPQKRRGF